MSDWGDDVRSAARRCTNAVKRGGHALAALCRRVWRVYAGLYRGRPWYVKALAAGVSFIVLFALYLLSVDVNFLGLYGKSPDIETIKNPVVNEASELYSADGVLIGKYFSENRTPVEYGDVNPVFWETLIATEDARFYYHFGIDFQGLAAAAKDFIVHNDARGASTITQQLAKNMFRTRSQYSTGLLGNIPGLKIIIMKSKEWITAVKIEMLFDKEQILTMYANTVDFGSNAFGIKTACKTYFGNTPAELTTEQAAVLVGMLKATTYYNPKINPKNSLRRRNIVLDNLADNGYISQHEADSLKQLPIDLKNYRVESNYSGQAPYFREAVAACLKDWCKENGYELYNSGLKIYTTLDTRLQKYAEDAARKQMKNVQRNFNAHWGKTNPWQDERHVEIEGFIEGIAKKLPVYKQLAEKYGDDTDSIGYWLNAPHTVKLFDYDNDTLTMYMSTMDSIRYMVRFMHCGFVAMEPATGHVKAWVGDVDFGSWKYDKVTAMRQPGSTFKLFVYTEAMNQGLTPCDTRVDEYFGMKVYDSKKKKDVLWAPTNANGYFSNDTMPLKAAFARSTNSIAVKIGQEVGIPNIAATAHAMGINSPLDETPSLALGASDVTLLELVNAYCTVVDDGRAHEPVLVTKILDRNGKVIYLAPESDKQAIPYRSAFLMQQMLMGGLREPGGTSMSLWTYIGKHADTEFGGKTGTSNNHSDAWFVGVCPNLVCGAWVGGEYRSIHFRTGALGQGSRTALPVCGLFFQYVMDDPDFTRYHGRFNKPTSDVTPGMYLCPSYYERKDTDSIAADSLLTDYEIRIDENGDTTRVPIPRKTDNDSTETTGHEPLAVDATDERTHRAALLNNDSNTHIHGR